MPGEIRKRKGKSKEALPTRDPDPDEEAPSDAGLWTLFKLVLLIMFGLPLFLLLVLLLFFPPKFEAQPNEVLSPPEWTGPMVPNNALENAERLFDGQVFGPESLVEHEGHLYTGTSDGKVLHIEGGHMRVLAALGKPPCGGIKNEPTCGRPLGMRISKDGYLYVIDTYQGLFRINPATGDSHLLLSSEATLAGKSLSFMNDIDIDSEGLIYISDSSKWQRRQFMYSLLKGSGDGRLIRYDPKSNKTELLMTGLHFANGVQISRDGSFVLVAETTKARILKYHITGPKKGITDIFADNLPGLPDNVRRCRTGGFWIGFAVARKSDAFSLFDFLQARPALRTFLSRIPIELLMSAPLPPSGLVVQLDNDGNIVLSLHDVNGKTIVGVSEVEEDADGTLYMGSYHAPYIGKLKRPYIK